MASIVVITTQDDAAHAFPESAIDDRLLIPGLPNEIAIRCLARVPYMRRLPLGLVCKSWRDAFRGGTIYNIRQREGILEELLCVSFLDKAHGRLVLKILDEASRKWAPLSSEYRHTKCKVRSFHCRAFRHKVFVFTRDEWALIKNSNLAMLGITRAGAGGGEEEARGGGVGGREGGEGEAVGAVGGQGGGDGRGGEVGRGEGERGRGADGGGERGVAGAAAEADPTAGGRGFGGGGGGFEVSNVVTCYGRFYTLDHNFIHEYNLEMKQWERAVQLPSRHRWAGTFRQCYFLVSLDGKLCVIDTWQEKWLWMTGKVKANASFLEFPEEAAEGRVGEGLLGSRRGVDDTSLGLRRVARCRSASGLRYSWSRVHMPVETEGRELAGYAVFQV
ncbi:hypothetical protein CLOP_g8608 [Closterium sp. NIES-67]|nr:hypothetical protein CLOP_g8608 [Closterium sp. NIES-67]